MKKIYLLILSLSLAGILNAQFEDSIHIRQLGEVIVSTGQYRQQSIKNSVYQVRVINQTFIRNSGALNVQQVLNSQLGFRFSADNTLGTSDVELMGMSGRNVKILLDGIPMIDRGDSRESLNQVDINSIDRIEIVEGPMSVSYGSDALAGVINIITKKAVKYRLSIRAAINEETAGREYYPFSYKGMHQQHLSMDWQNKGWKTSLGSTHLDFDGFGGNVYGRDKIWKPKEQWLAFMRTGYSNARFNIYYRMDGLQEKITSRGKMGLTYQAIDQRYITNRITQQLQGEWQLIKNIQLNSLLAYTDYKRRTRTTEHDFTRGTDLPTNGAGEQDTSRFNSFTFRSTVQYILSPTISIQPGIDINREGASGARIAGNPVITDYAFFVSAEFKPSNKLNIRPGLRLIKNSVYKAPPAIPSVNAKLILSQQFDLRAAYAYGFRSPALRELYFDFHDANHDIVGNRNLKAEHSNSFSASLGWTPVHPAAAVYSLTLGGFYNDFRNLINYAVNPDNTAEYKTVNIDRFKTTGFTLENKLKKGKLDAGIGFSCIARFNQVSDNAAFKDQHLSRFAWTPEFNSNITYTFKKPATTISLFYKYSGNRPGYEIRNNSTNGQEEVHLTRIDAFHWLDVTGTQPLFKYLTVTGGIKNLFDVSGLNNTSTDPGGVHSSGGPVPMGYGRSYFLGLSFQWNKK